MNAREQIEQGYAPMEWSEVALMFHVADDYEAQMLADLRVKAGLTWEHFGCWTNVAEDAVCGNCGKPFHLIPEEERAGEPYSPNRRRRERRLAQKSA